MKRFALILAVFGLVSCASFEIPSDVRDFVNEPGHQEVASKCAACHLNLTDSVE